MVQMAHSHTWEFSFSEAGSASPVAVHPGTWHTVHRHILDQKRARMHITTMHSRLRSRQGGRIHP